MEFPHANVARALLNNSTSYENLFNQASTAIAIEAKNLQNYADITYDNVADFTHVEFHRKIRSMGYEGEKRSSGNHTIYRIRW